MGREIILKIGPMSVLAVFLDLKCRIMLNLLCKHVYEVVMPGISGRVLIGASREFPDWLERGKDAAALSKTKFKEDSEDRLETTQARISASDKKMAKN